MLCPKSDIIDWYVPDPCTLTHCTLTYVPRPGVSGRCSPWAGEGVGVLSKLVLHSVPLGREEPETLRGERVGENIRLRFMGTQRYNISQREREGERETSLCKIKFRIVPSLANYTLNTWVMVTLTVNHTTRLQGNTTLSETSSCKITLSTD